MISIAADAKIVKVAPEMRTEGDLQAKVESILATAHESSREAAEE